MSKPDHDHDDIRRILQDVLPPVNAELPRDLWPALSRTIDARAQRFAWYDFALAAVAVAAIAAFPDLALALLYHL